ncbi:MAG: patatin-like phospholipase family protein [Inquilinus sp.]|uniref:patatin-like phospholipase family protein n=1 Tax=Inquilinus sp. TaxID=1932117 RepID=UPI003F3EBDDE
MSMDEVLPDRKMHSAAPLPTDECDIVMRGGVTSGVVYPGAVFEIAGRYRLRSVGGTSAGAIAAAVTAAMEFGRTTGLNPDALAAIAGLPGKLATETDSKRPFLFHLFAPDEQTKPVFDFVLALKSNVLCATLGAMVRLIGRPMIIGLIAGFILVGAVSHFAGLAFWPAVAVTLLGGLGVGIVLAIAAVFAAQRWSTAAAILGGKLKAVRDNHFGLCTGMTRSGRTVAGPKDTRIPVPALTEWLHETIQKAAGLPPKSPLTFGDLWSANHRNTGNSREDAMVSAANGGDPRESRRQIDLVLIGTDLSRCRSLRFPFLDGSTQLYVRRSDLERLFPAEVVEWMSEHQGKAPSKFVLNDSESGNDPVFPLPSPQDLPIVFAARASMSFPLLFSAVRLYVPRWTSTPEGRVGYLFEIWLSDGGITSNFPVHLFDSPIPTRPTFCLNLVYPGETLEEQQSESPEEASRNLLDNGHRSDEELVYMPSRNGEAVSMYARLPDGPLPGLMSFVSRIPYVARLWADSELMIMPGQLDRIVHIRMREGEGGFNLDMPKDAIDSLNRRGMRAGAVIAERFRPGQTIDPLDPSGKKQLRLNWANHRFVRLRAALAGFEVALSQFSWSLRMDTRTQSPNLLRMISSSGTKLSQYVGYDLANKDQKKFVLREAIRLHRLARIWSRHRSSGKLTFDGPKGSNGTSPRPKQLYRLRGSASQDPAQGLPPDC